MAATKLCNKLVIKITTKFWEAKVGSAVGWRQLGSGLCECLFVIKTDNEVNK